MKLNIDQIKVQLLSNGEVKVSKSAFDDDMKSIYDYYDRAYQNPVDNPSDIVKFVKSKNKDLIEFSKIYLSPQLTYGIGRLEIVEEIPGVITIRYIS